MNSGLLEILGHTGSLSGRCPAVAGGKVRSKAVYIIPPGESTGIL
jgi:hypothetical protein